MFPNWNNVFDVKPIQVSHVRCANHLRSLRLSLQETMLSHFLRYFCNEQKRNSISGENKRSPNPNGKTSETARAELLHKCRPATPRESNCILARILAADIRAEFPRPRSLPAFCHVHLHHARFSTVSFHRAAAADPLRHRGSIQKYFSRR